MDPIVGWLHNVIIKCLFFVSTDVQDVHETFVLSRDRFEFLDTTEFLFVNIAVLETRTPNYLDGSVGSQNIPREPNFAERPISNSTKHFVVRDARLDGWVRSQHRHAWRAKEIANHFPSDGVPVCQQQRSANHRLKFGDVARPGMLSKTFDCIAGD